jgi:YfiH family protein
LRQVHGAEVHVVRAPGAVQGDEGDALVTMVPGVALAVFTADCAPVAMTSPEGVAGLVHAGWRGLDAGVIGAAASAMRDLGATRIEAALGPCIRAECYEFGAADLERLAARWGPGVRGRTTAGQPALDLPAAVRAALQQCGAELVADAGACTACSEEWFSHRARGDVGRQATVLVAA